jgi:anti-sigma factor RsiW
MSTTDNISPIPDSGANKKPLNEDRMLAYLEGKLSPAEQHEVELWLADDGMETDAIDGLKEIDAVERKQSIGRLNNSLHKSLSKKGRKRRGMKTDINVLVAVAIVLLLAAAAWLVLRVLI